MLFYNAIKQGKQIYLEFTQIKIKFILMKITGES